MRTILQGVVGSHAYGLATPESDVDRLASHLGPIGDILSFGVTKGDQTLATTKPDRTSHEVAKFLGLALQGNPTVTELLWLPEYEVLTIEGQMLLNIREKLLAAKRVHDAYGGYAFHQLHRLLNRHAEGKDGFSADTKKRTNKHARHLMRLLIQGEALLRTGELKVRLSPSEVTQCRWVGTLAEEGRLEGVKREFDMFLKALDVAYENTVLPKAYDREAAKNVLIVIRSRQISGHS